MKRSRTEKLLCLIVAVMFLTGCSTTTIARDFSGVSTPDGKAIGHVSTNNVGLHLLMGKKPLWGDASLEKTVTDFTLAARAENASKVRIVQSKRTAWWFLFFPFTLVFTPVTTNVAGDAIA